jgi:hypothetical protein
MRPVPGRAPHKAYTRNEPHVHALDPHVPMATKVGSVTNLSRPVLRTKLSTNYMCAQKVKITHISTNYDSIKRQCFIT